MADEPRPPLVHNFSVEPELVSAMLEDAGMTLKEIGQRLGTYRQSVWRRRSALEEKGVIWGTTAVVDYHRLGWSHYFVFLQTRKPTKEELKRLRAFVYKVDQRRNLRVIGSHMLGAGDFTFLVELAAQNRLEVDRFLEKLGELAEDRLRAPPQVQEAVFSIRQSGFVNPFLVKLEDMASDM